MITFDDVQRAADRLSGVVFRTPVISSPSINERVGAEVFLKAENLQVTGSFKFRGGYSAVSGLDDDARASGVVAYSSGNHAQGVARAATLCGSSSVIVMPNDAPESKVAGTKANGARVVRYDRYSEDRAEIANQIANDEGRTIIPPYDHPLVMAGQGTTALELVDQVNGLDALFVCVGGGGLLSGCATVLETLAPEAAIYGVEPEASNDHLLSMAAGKRVTIDIATTIADGQQLGTPGELTWPINQRLATGFVTVSDAEIVDTMKLLFAETKLVVEPSGASALAGLLHARNLNLAGKRIGVTLSGGNVSFERFRDLTA